MAVGIELVRAMEPLTFFHMKVFNAQLAIIHKSATQLNTQFRRSTKKKPNWWARSSSLGNHAANHSSGIIEFCLHHIPTAPTQSLRFSSNLPCHAQSSPIGQPFVLALEAHVFGNPCQGKPGAISTFDSIVVRIFVSGSRRKQVPLLNQFFPGGWVVKEVVPRKRFLACC
jgi:hypothetical protein